VLDGDLIDRRIPIPSRACFKTNYATPYIVGRMEQYIYNLISLASERHSVA